MNGPRPFGSTAAKAPNHCLLKITVTKSPGSSISTFWLNTLTQYLDNNQWRSWRPRRLRHGRYSSEFLPWPWSSLGSSFGLGRSLKLSSYTNLVPRFVFILLSPLRVSSLLSPLANASTVSPQNRLPSSSRPPLEDLQSFLMFISLVTGLSDSLSLPRILVFISISSGPSKLPTSKFISTSDMEEVPIISLSSGDGMLKNQLNGPLFGLDWHGSDDLLVPVWTISTKN